MLQTKSHTNLSPQLQVQYKILKIYSFFWWACYSTLVVFQPLYLYKIGIPLWGIFLNSAFGAIISLIFMNFWSSLADQKQIYKPFMILGNLFIAGACIFLLFIENYWMVLILTFILRSGPFSDGFTTVLVYKIADQIQGEEINNPIDRKFHQINMYAQQRKFGSIGWAIMLPIIAIFVNIYGIGINFIVGAIGLVVLSFICFFLIDENLIHDTHNKEIPKLPNMNNSSIPTNSQSKKASFGFFAQIKQLSQNKLFIAFLIAGLIYAAAQNMTYEVQGIYYSMFSNENYVILVLIYSVAAFTEWPIMSVMAQKVKSIGWEKMIMIAYILTGINLGLVPFILLFNGTIWFGYGIQIMTGIVFGLRQPTTTFGLYTSLEKNQKSLGQSLFQTNSLVGAFLGHLIGALISFITPEGISVFYGIYWFAAIIAIGSAFIFYFIKPKINQ